MKTSTTTIRVDRETHAALLKMSQATGRPLMETVKAATEALRRQAFADRVRAELEAMSSDELESYRAEVDTYPVGDGLDR